MRSIIAWAYGGKYDGTLSFISLRRKRDVLDYAPVIRAGRSTDIDIDQRQEGVYFVMPDQHGPQGYWTSDKYVVRLVAEYRDGVGDG